MKFLDTVVEDVDRIKKGRSNINIGITLLFVGFIIYSIIFLVFYGFGYKASAIFLMLFCVMDLILIFALIIKREIYSIAILIKEKKE